MITRLSTSIAAILLGLLPLTALGQQDFVVEWSDHPSKKDWMGSDPVFQRTLECWGTGQTCQLTVITIGRDFCPVVLHADSFRTDTGDLKVSHIGNAVDLQFTDLSNTWTLHLALRGNPPIVDQASGVVVTKAMLPQDRVRSSELTALVEKHKWYAGREFAQVDLKCAEIAVVAAKRPAK